MNYDVNNKKPFIVYCHTNLINGKKYIGITCQTPEQRFRNGKGYRSSPHFYNAIQKYGWDNFSHSILFSNLSIEEAKEKEIELIKRYQTRIQEYGYNMTPGGEGFSGADCPWFGRHLSDEHKKKISEGNRGKVESEETKRKKSIALSGRVISEESKAKMRGSRPQVSGANNPMYGKKRDLEHMAKMRFLSKTPEAIEKMKAHKVWYSGDQNPNAKAVRCIETGKIYTTVNEAAKDNDCNPSKISAVCHGDRQHTKHLHFEFVKEE